MKRIGTVVLTFLLIYVFVSGRTIPSLSGARIASPADTTPPRAGSVIAVSFNRVDVRFSEPVSLSSAKTSANFSVDQGIGYPQSAARDSSDLTLVHLQFVHSLASGTYYTLTVTGIQDLAGNTDAGDLRMFLFFLPQVNDVVINEIMADPDPPAGLPAFEYLELFNRTPYPVSMAGWTVSTPSYSKIFPAGISILPDSFLLLCPASAMVFFQPFGPALGIFPSSSVLSNAGTTLVLKNNSGNIINAVTYKDTWYQDPVKESGGWSLERIDPASPCSGKSNWKASVDASGGTPGRRNSVKAAFADLAPPKISYISLLSANSIELFFDESLDSLTVIPANFYIEGMAANPVTADPVEPDYSSAILTLPSSLHPGTVYKVIASGVKDCAGNPVSSGQAMPFALPEPAGPNDIAINEIMFDPKENGTEWIEIYNRSEKTVDLRDVFLCNLDANGSVLNLQPSAAAGRLFFPKSYLVLSKDQNAIKSQYASLNPDGFSDMPSFITLNNDSSFIALIGPGQTIIDQVHYHSDWHLPLLSSTKGISLERINYDLPAQDENNWHSAAESTGGATPAYLNSQYTDGKAGADLAVSPEVFSPDNDGYNDVLAISYAFSTPGLVGNLQIYDAQGRLTRSLVCNELLGTSGTFYWDGITNERARARLGIYIISFEAFDSKGWVRRYKKSCVVAEKP